MNYQDKVVIITGAGSGIGAELARQLSSAGAKIVLAGRRENRLQEVAQACRGETFIVRTDVAQTSDLEKLLNATRERFQRIDVVVSNAGVGYGGALWDFREEDIDYSTRVNFTAPLQLVRLAAPMLSEGGQIVIVSSLAPLAPLPYHSLYTGQKGGLYSMCKALRQDMHLQGLKLSCVLPGTVWSEMMSEDFHALLKEGGLPVAPMATVRAVNMMVHGMQQEREEILVLSGFEQFLVQLYRFLPHALEGMLAKSASTFRHVMRKTMESHRTP